MVRFLLTALILNLSSFAGAAPKRCLDALGERQLKMNLGSHPTEKEIREAYEAMSDSSDMPYYDEAQLRRYAQRHGMRIEHNTDAYGEPTGSISVRSEE